LICSLKLGPLMSSPRSNHFVMKTPRPCRLPKSFISIWNSLWYRLHCAGNERLNYPWVNWKTWSSTLPTCQSLPGSRRPKWGQITIPNSRGKLENFQEGILMMYRTRTSSVGSPIEGKTILALVTQWKGCPRIGIVLVCIKSFRDISLNQARVDDTSKL
jgi:hypothetical protein